LRDRFKGRLAGVTKQSSAEVEQEK
jgi:hypothetical protein